MMRDRILRFNYVKPCGAEWIKVNFTNFHETRTEKTHSTHVTFIRPRVPVAGESNLM